MEDEGGRPDLSGAERDVLKVLWECGPGTVRQVSAALEERGKTWKYTTVLTLLQRLAAKGYAEADASGPAHVYDASATLDEVVHHRLKDVARQYCDGDSVPLVLNLVRSESFTADELRRFRRLLDELESDRSDPAKRS